MTKWTAYDFETQEFSTHATVAEAKKASAPGGSWFRVTLVDGQRVWEKAMPSDRDLFVAVWETKDSAAAIRDYGLEWTQE